MTREMKIALAVGFAVSVASAFVLRILDATSTDALVAATCINTVIIFCVIVALGVDRQIIEGQNRRRTDH